MAGEETSEWVLDPEAFPLYYPLSAPFMVDGTPTGAVGARAELVKTINNFPHIFYGVRIRNVYPLPSVELADAFRAVRLLDNDQTIRIDLAQENITAQATLQDLVVGGSSGDGGQVVHWHPFPKPYLLAGGNEIRVELQRLTGYPNLDDDNPVLPVARAALVTSVHRRDFRTQPPQRVRAPGT